tara:strand:- start:6535 stop:6705 length:171 start_codon:yes stop_codon:yes gene_type:complete
MTYTNGKVDDDDNDGIYCERVNGEVLCVSFSEYIKKGFVPSEAIPIRDMIDPPKGH